MITHEEKGFHFKTNLTMRIYLMKGGGLEIHEYIEKGLSRRNFSLQNFCPEGNAPFLAGVWVFIVE